MNKLFPNVFALENVGESKETERPVQMSESWTLSPKHLLFTYLFVSFWLPQVFTVECGLSPAVAGDCSPVVVHRLLITVAAVVAECGP